MNKRLIIPFALALALPVAAVAATYDYVDMSGNIASVDAADAPQAMVLAVNKAPTSGVVLDRGVLKGQLVSTDASTYQYVDMTGSIRVVDAMTADEALVIAVNKAPTSGVIPAVVVDLPSSVHVTVQ